MRRAPEELIVPAAPRAPEKSLATPRDRALASLAALGIPPSGLETRRLDELEAVGAELDRFYAFGYGQSTQRLFLHSPHPGLSGRTPAEVLADPDGVTKFGAAVRETLVSVSSTR